ncbi:MAG TPA: hypothetical protein PLK90_00280 [Clostridiales bacterium]|nr:hypothetical protein [Clostridiales bacterium]HQP68814.1 hypothetical protein [Clostridiales bacterium]
MKKTVLVAILSLLFSVWPKNIQGTAEGRFGDDLSISGAKEKFKKEAVRNGLENFAMFISSETVIKDYELQKDIIVAKIEADVRNVKEEYPVLDRNEGYIKCVVTFDINEDEVLRKLKELSEELKKKSADSIENIKLSGQYYFGEMSDKSAKKAEDGATDKLIENIAVDIKDNFADLIDESEDLFDYTRSNICTYRTDFDQYFKRKTEGETVLKYIKKDELPKMFDQRVRMIGEYLGMAVKHEKDLNVGSAVRYYYWGLSLLRSYPYYKNIKINDLPEEFSGKMLALALPDKINSIMKSLSFEINDIREEKDSKTVYFTAKFRNSPVQDLDYRYFMGSDSSIEQPVRNGTGSCEFYGEYAKNLDRIRFDVEYRYEKQSCINKSLNRVIEGVAGARFETSRIIVPLNAKQAKPVVSEPVVKVENFRINNVSAVNNSNVQDSVLPKIEPAEKKNYEATDLSQDQIDNCNSITAEIVKAIKSCKYEGIDKFFTPEGLKTFNSIIKYGNARMMSDTFDLKTAIVNDQITVRSIPMKFTHKGNTKATMEDVNIIFNKDLLIDHLSFSLSNTSIGDILKKSDAFATAAEKMQIIQFMEFYKTAYCLKQLDYINNIFAENAIIIIGKMLNPDPTKNIGEMQNQIKDKVRYTKLSKSEYIENLRSAFKSNEFINIQFDSTDIKKAGNGERIYGIQIKQNYYSSNYADEGYLFLMMDLGDPKKPKIYVRSWQPEKNPDGSIIGITDFSF